MGDRGCPQKVMSPHKKNIVSYFNKHGSKILAALNLLSRGLWGYEQYLPLTHQCYYRSFNPIQDGLFPGCSRMEGGLKRLPLPKICHTYPTMMKLGSIIPYPKKIQKIYESRDTPLEFCWHEHFFTGNQQILLYQEIQI